MTNLREQFINVHKIFWQILWKLKIFSSGLERLLKTQFLKKKTSNVSSEENFMAPFFSFYRVSQTSKDSLQGYSRFFRHYYVCYKINSLGHRRLLKTHFFERKANFPVKKSFWPNRPPINECDKPQGTVNISSEARVTITLEKLRSFLLDLRGCWRHNFLKKKRKFFQWRKVFGLIVLLPSSVIKLRGQFILVQKLVSQLPWKN